MSKIEKKIDQLAEWAQAQPVKKQIVIAAMVIVATMALGAAIANAV